ncbi:hypothetical protein A2U01_0051617 [Trifolium medium]|uniref:Uncharacterized protein n=1 Tax=Trifolium medium TaxID=97028 RepID=A0A392R1E9_9FABA|nr:hypothetical protein [Trifolium medium]
MSYKEVNRFWILGRDGFKEAEDLGVRLKSSAIEFQQRDEGRRRPASGTVCMYMSKDSSLTLLVVA